MKQWFPDGGGSCKHEHPHLADLKERVGGEEVDMKGGGGGGGGEQVGLETDSPCQSKPP